MLLHVRVYGGFDEEVPIEEVLRLFRGTQWLYKLAKSEVIVLPLGTHIFYQRVIMFHAPGFLPTALYGHLESLPAKRQSCNESGYVRGGRARLSAA